MNPFFMRNNSGATALEFALIAAPLFLFTFGIIEISRLVFMQQSIGNALDTAARALYISGNITEEEISDIIASNTFLAKSNSILVQKSLLISSGGIDELSKVKITVNYNFESLIPSFLIGQIPLEFERIVITGN